MPAAEQRIAGVIGDPVEHSRSPAMHNAAFQALGITAHYERWHTKAADLPSRIETLRNPQYLGANVTLPHKIAILDLVDLVDPEVQLIGAANTIIRQPDGSLRATNTDAPAVLATLQQDAGFQPKGKTIVILGARGAARAAAYSLTIAGAAQITIINRTLELAEELLADLITATATEIPLFALQAETPEATEYTNSADLLINATSLGWQPDELPIDPKLIQPQTLVFDMVYRPTALLQAASAIGAATLNGRGMLVRQAGLAFEHWVQRPAPIDLMFAAFDADQR